MTIPQPVIDLYDAFTHGRLSRRDFMQRLTKQAGGAAAATAMLSLLRNDYAMAAMVADDDGRLTTGTDKINWRAGSVNAYTAAPKSGGKRASVIVIHENRGLNAHIKDIARRIALEGFNAYAPDLLTEMGGTPADEDKARDMIGKLDAAKAVQNLTAVLGHANAKPDATAKSGAVGFCWGGGMTNQLAVHAQNLNAAVAYYGPQPADADAAKIKAAVMLHYAAKDEWVGKGIKAYEAALTAAKVEFQAFVYAGAQHAFNNDTNAARYDKASAELAWGRTIGFLKAKLT